MSQRNIDQEIIVVDDCSDDETEFVIMPFLNHVTFIQNEENVGVAESSNIGLRASKSQFYIRVDADDFISADTC